MKLPFIISWNRFVTNYHCCIFSNYFKMQQKFKFLCWNFNNRKFIFATKFNHHPWYYFEERHTIIFQHDSLPAKLEEVIATFEGKRTVEIILNEIQVQNYYINGKFIFKDTELKTCTAHLYCT